MKTVLFRCDASKKIGLGHVVRCLVLAKKFLDYGSKVIFAMKEDMGIEYVQKENFRVAKYNSKYSYEEWCDYLIKEFKFNIFVGDVRDGFPSEYITKMKSLSILTIAIDEPSSYSYECDLCFYPPHAIVDKPLYKGKVFKGLQYVLLRDEFYEPFEKAKNDIPNVLVMMGGTDAHNLTYEIVEMLDKDEKIFNIEVILNKENNSYYAIKEKLNSFKHQVSLHNNTINMPIFLKKIDYAIVLFGTVVYELIQMKVPFTFFTLDKFKKKEYNFFKDFNGTLELLKNKTNLKIDFSNLYINNEIHNKVFEEIIKEDRWN